MMCKNIFQSIGLVYDVDKKKDEERKKKESKTMEIYCSKNVLKEILFLKKKKKEMVLIIRSNC